MVFMFNPLTPELNPSAQRCLPGFLQGILIFKWLTARRLCKSFGVKGLRCRFSGMLRRVVWSRVFQASKNHASFIFAREKYKKRTSQNI
jgi:hypothetical protein